MNMTCEDDLLQRSTELSEKISEQLVNIAVI